MSLAVPGGDSGRAKGPAMSSVDKLRRRQWRTPAAAVLAGVAVAAMLTGPASAGKASYQDPGASVQTRVADLLRRMTVEEKAGQLQQIAVTRLEGDCYWSGGELKEQCLKEILADEHAGSILSGGGMPPSTNTPRAWAEMTNTIQRYAIGHSRLGIPIVYGVDAVHGHNNVLGATMFPQQIGMGATWDPALAGDVAQSAQRAVAATGISWNFSPVADLARDHRWGRYYEAYAEDPLLAGTPAASPVKGYQDGSSGRQLAATVKHFAGYSQPINGHDRVPAEMSMRYLQDTILPAYRQAVAAGSLTVMVNSGADNGIPAHASNYLLTDVLRGQWGFDGLVVSDWNDVRSLQSAYHVSGDYEHAIAKAVNAGVDLCMLPPDDRTFAASLLAAIHDGLISRSRLDQAAGRVLALKFRLGLFDHPYVDPDSADDIVLGADKDLARRAAAESAVLLRNQEHALPIGKGKKVLVTGPSADSMPNQLGGWSIGWQGVPDGVDVPGTTIVEGLKANAPDGTTVTYEPDPAKAVDAAPAADVVLAAARRGERPAGVGQGAQGHRHPGRRGDGRRTAAGARRRGRPGRAADGLAPRHRGRQRRRRRAVRHRQPERPAARLLAEGPRQRPALLPATSRYERRPRVELPRGLPVRGGAVVHHVHDREAGAGPGHGRQPRHDHGERAGCQHRRTGR